MSGLWNFSVRVQSWSDKIESDPVLIRKFLKIISPIQYWSVNVKSCIFILPHEAKELMKLFCLLTNMIGWRQSSPAMLLPHEPNRHSLLVFPKFNKEVSIRHQTEKHCWSYLAIMRIRLLRLVKWQERYTWIDVRPLLHDLKPQT